MEDLLTLIKAMQSVRGPLDESRAISKEDLHQILEATSWAPTAHNMQNFEIVVVDDKKILQAIGDIKFEMPKAALARNNNFSSSTEEDLRQKKTGILSRMPEQEENPANALGDFIKKSITSASTLLIAMYDPSKRAPGPEEDVLGKISFGCIMENMWLMAHSLGIGMQILSLVSLADFNKPLKEILGVPDNFKFAFSCRMGYPVSTSGNQVRVRREVEEFTHYNGYGKTGNEQG